MVNRHLDQLSQIELATLLEQLNKEQFSGFQTLEQVEQRRRERNIEITKLRNAARQVIAGTPTDASIVNLLIFYQGNNTPP
jgi:hypothetical protein